MIARYHRISLLWGVPGILLQLSLFIAMLVCMTSSMMDITMNPDKVPKAVLPSTHLIILLTLAEWVGTVMLLVGLAYYAKAKGQSKAWCLVAFFPLFVPVIGLIGPFVLSFLKDENILNSYMD